MNGITEKIAHIDSARTLVGIVTAPATPATPDADSPPAIIVLNTGIVHRVGHNRMFVSFAREMAAAGHAVLRFDLSGIGDSGNRHDAVPPLVASMADIREAVDWMERRGYRRIVLMGLCSGADQSIVYAADDPRITGLVLLDPSIPQTRRFLREARRQRAIAFYRRHGPFAIFGRVRKSVQARLSLRRRERTADELAVEEDGVPTSIGIERPEVRDYIESAYQRAIAAKIQIFALFTGGLPHQHNYRDQIIDAFPGIDFRNNLELDYIGQVDHMFVRAPDRRDLFDRIGKWLATTRFATPNS